MLPTSFYIVPEDVFRLGNADHPRMSHVRPRDVDSTEVNGILVVVANNKGISVFDAEGITRTPMSGWIWKFFPGTQLPQGLKLVQDKPHHYCIAPITNMPMDKYKGLLEELGLKATRIMQKPGVRA